MALQISYDAPTGDSYADAYVRVNYVGLATLDRVARIQVATYRDQAARLAGREPVRMTEQLLSGGDYDAHFSTTVLSASTNPVAQAYDYLKTLPAYAGALDV